MAGRHALLIGISSYGEGLAPIPSARLDVEALSAVLRDPELGGIPPERLRLLTDPDRTEMEIEIESFYANKQPDDLLVLYFSGHGFRDEADRQLLLSTRQSRRVSVDGKSRVQVATTLPASIVRRHMERSRSTRQVVILDCCFSGAFAEGMAAKDAGTLPIEALLGGKGRAVLTSSDAIETSRAPEDGEGLSLYTRFLVEGIQTGAADRQGRGFLEAEDLHHYTLSRVLEAAPRMTPQFFPTKEGHRIRVCQVRRDPSVGYRRKVRELAEKRQGVLTSVGRAILEDLRKELGLAAEAAARIEAEVLRPFAEYQEKLALYREALREQLQAHGPSGGALPEQDREELQELEQRLKLRPADVAAIHRELGVTVHEAGQQPAPTGPAQPITEGRQHGQRSGSERIQDPAPDPTPAPQQPDPATPANSLLSIPTTRGWLVREGDQWQPKTEPITVAGFEEELAPGIGMRLVRIPAGDFQMGSPATESGRYDDEGPQHPVRLKGFFLGQTPVTQAQWQVVAAWPKQELELNPDPSAFQGPNRPVEQVSWDEAMEFCRRLSQRTRRDYTLPSEAQWEYACRAGTTTPFAFGETLTPEFANYDANHTYGSGPKGTYRQATTDVGTFPANAWGLQDMHGNVWEWCLDPWHDNYQGAPSDGRAWVSEGSQEARRLLRGGSWDSHPWDCRSASRVRRLQGDRNFSVGFRLCVSPPGLVS